jgi:hypothetical protein
MDKLRHYSIMEMVNGGVEGHAMRGGNCLTGHIRGRKKTIESHRKMIAPDPFNAGESTPSRNDVNAGRRLDRPAGINLGPLTIPF